MTNENIIKQLKRLIPSLQYADDVNAVKGAIQALSQEPCENTAQERYKDLCEYFGGAKDILKSREDFKAWLERIKWHIRKAEELYEKYEYKKEPCDDAISRQAVLEEIDVKAWEFCDYLISKNRNDEQKPVSHFADNLRECIREDLPSVKPQEQKWIPVSERLPEPFRFVNCTCRSLIDDREDWVVETVYVPQVSDSPYSDWGNIPMLNSGDCKVVAWMYRDIPKPYKAESEEE